MHVVTSRQTCTEVEHGCEPLIFLSPLYFQQKVAFKAVCTGGALINFLPGIHEEVIWFACAFIRVAPD